MQKVSPFLWFEHEAEEAVNHYVSIFPDGRVTLVQHYEGMGGPQPSVQLISFVLGGVEFTAMNGGPRFEPPTGAISFVVECQDQMEVDHYWDRLSDGGTELPCGWLKDRFGVAWQVVPRQLVMLLDDPDRAKAGRAMQAMLSMKKLVIADLEQAALQAA
jgi:predicted 3-demethylubiquinone-9 3-methyltransferase (glyoxalase superfamily)